MKRMTESTRHLRQLTNEQIKKNQMKRPTKNLLSDQIRRCRELRSFIDEISVQTIKEQLELIEYNLKKVRSDATGKED